MRPGRLDSLVTPSEIAEAGELDLLPAGQRGTDFLEEKIHQLTRFTLVEAELIEQRLRISLSLAISLSRILAFKFSRRSALRKP